MVKELQLQLAKANAKIHSLESAQANPKLQPQQVAHAPTSDPVGDPRMDTEQPKRTKRKAPLPSSQADIDAKFEAADARMAQFEGALLRLAPTIDRLVESCATMAANIQTLHARLDTLTNPPTSATPLQSPTPPNYPAPIIVATSESATARSRAGGILKSPVALSQRPEPYGKRDG